MLNKAVDLTIFGIAISFSSKHLIFNSSSLILAILSTSDNLLIVEGKYFDKKLNNSKGEKQDSNYDKALAASVAVSLVESELEHYKKLNME